MRRASFRERTMDRAESVFGPTTPSVWRSSNRRAPSALPSLRQFMALHSRWR